MAHTALAVGFVLPLTRIGKRRDEEISNLYPKAQWIFLIIILIKKRPNE
jgi:hypothetical protein